MKTEIGYNRRATKEITKKSKIKEEDKDFWTIGKRDVDKDNENYEDENKENTTEGRW